MKILFPYVGDTFGGSHRSSLLLVEGLNNQPGVEAITAIHLNYGILSDFLSENGFSYQVLPGVTIVESEPLFRQIVKMVKVAFPLASYLKNNSIDIVHVNDRCMHLTWLLASRLAGSRIVWHQRSQGASGRIAWYSRLADAVVTISSYCKYSFPSTMKQRFVVVPNPVGSNDSLYDYGTSRELVLSELGLGEDFFVISWVGNWTRQKRPIDFVKFSAMVHEHTNKKIVFVMFGEPREPVGTEVRNRIREAGLEECIHVMGIKTPIEPYIQGSDLLVATAEAEGHGRTLIEAMFLRTPVVATADGGHLEIIDDGVDGWLVPVGDVQAMADAAMEVMESSSEVTLRVDAAEQKVRKNFTLEAHVRSIMRIYEGIQS